MLADDPETFAEKAQLVIDDAAERGRWEEAFQLSLQIDHVGEAAEIAGRAARSLLASGQSETLEKWLSACGAAAVTVPGAALARAELLIRKGEMAAATAMARDTARGLRDDDEITARAHNLAGQALHFTSHEESARESFRIARDTAATDEDLKDALWGLVRVSVELEPSEADAYLDELERSYWDDLDVRFRVAVGRAIASEQVATLEGVWDRFSALLPSVAHSKDPLVATSFLTTAASAAVAGAKYSIAKELAERALRISTDLRLDFALGACLMQRAAAEIGLRRFSRARRTLSSFSRSSICREDPFFRLEGLKLQARLLASQGAHLEALATREEMPPEDGSARALGIYLATLAMVLAASGDADAARKMAATARNYGSNIEMRYCAQLGEVIAEKIDGREAGLRKRVRRLVAECGRAEYLDGLVFAFRVHPPLLEDAKGSPETLSITRRALTLSRDHELARRAGVRVQTADMDTPLGSLTPREREVLGLLTQGLTN
ncbi:MAG TPA: hypothetical protein VIG29_09330, partial [Vicinamibacteria bacterium]